MADIRIDTGFLNHVKTKKLERLVRSDGVLCLIRLWAYAAEYRSRGLLHEMDAADIEIAAGWNGNDGELINALIKVRYIDRPDGVYALHNWEDRNPYAFHAKDRSERARKAANKRWESKTNANSMPDACAEHADSMQTECSRYAPAPAPTPINNGANSANECLERFNRFYSEYPVKQKKADTLKWFQRKKNQSVDIEMLITKVKEQKKIRETAAYFISAWPAPVVWLNGKRWEDELSNPEQEASAPVYEELL